MDYVATAKMLDNTVNGAVMDSVKAVVRRSVQRRCGAAMRSHWEGLAQPSQSVEMGM